MSCFHSIVCYFFGILLVVPCSFMTCFLPARFLLLWWLKQYKETLFLEKHQKTHKRNHFYQSFWLLIP